MRAGNLVYVIGIERSTTTVSPAGTPSHEWAPHKSARAEIVDRSAEEFLRSAGDTTETRIVFRTRYMLDVTTDDRIRFDGEAFDIEEIIPIGRRHGLEFRCIATEANA